MKVLAFDTSTRYLSIALADEGRTIAEFHEDVGIRHSEVLVPEISGLVIDAGLDMKDIDLLCVGTGPGSFTGLRIGVATAKGIVAVTGCGVKGVPSMDAMISKVPAGVKMFAPLLDARKGKVYSCIYRSGEDNPERIKGPELVTMDHLLSGLREKVLFFGDGTERYPELLEKCPLADVDSSIDWYPRASQTARLGAERSKEGTDDPGELDPMYLYSRECSITNE
jgi:tRNA threonylcarbamoyladenosine biosynthesis protein TsaB